MTKKPPPKNHYSRWKPSEVSQLQRLAKQRVLTDRIAKTLKRSLQSIYQNASTEGIALGGGRFQYCEQSPA